MKQHVIVSLFAVLLAMPCLPARSQQMSVELSLPDKGRSGERIPVTVTIRKDDYSDFARFRQALPNGFEVKPVETSGSDFSLKKGEINFIWLKMPPEQEVTLVYDLIPDPHLRGVFQFGGRFSYIVDQERKEVEVPERSVEIIPAAASEDAATLAATQPAADTLPAERPAAPAGPFVYRGTPVKSPDGQGWIIRLIVNRGPLEKLSRLEEIVPEGYLPENINGEGAIFSYRGGEVKYIWMTLPEDSVFEVSYKLVPAEGGSPGTPPLLSGYFSYMQGDRSQRVAVRQLPQEVPAEADESTLYALAAAGAATFGQEPPAAAGQTVAPTATQHETPPPVEQTQVPPPAVSHVSENKPGQPTEIVEQGPQTNEGIYFRVQILATTRPVEAEAYFREHHVPGRIYKEVDNGLYKYTTGSFASYRDARAFVNRLRETTDIDEAFVTAYDGDRRISVREALDRTGQKWFK